MTEQRKGDWLQMYSGGQFWPLDPRPSEIEIVDVAWSLSHICRYAGHCRDLYSVAEHSVLLSYAVPERYALWALLHDAPESYIGDIPAPVKRFIRDYELIENQIMAAVAIKFDLSWPIPAIVKEMDRRILLNEREALFENPLPWNIPLEPLPNVDIRCLQPKIANAQFLARYDELTHEDE